VTTPLTIPAPTTTPTPQPTSTGSLRPDIDAWAQLVDLSKRTNDIQKRLQQAHCNQGAGATDTGSWCQQAVKSQHVTDHPLAAELAKLFAGKSVLSLGDGRGEYKTLLLNAATPVKLRCLSVTFDPSLFGNLVPWSNHVLHTLLPPPSTASQRYNLRLRAHTRLLPEHSTHLSDCNFLTRMLYKNTY